MEKLMKTDDKICKYSIAPTFLHVILCLVVAIMPKAILSTVTITRLRTLIIPFEISNANMHPIVHPT